MDDFEEAIDRVVAGLEKRNRVMNPREKEIVAYHETGHALVAEALPTTDQVHRVSIIPRGIGALGYTMQLPTEDRYLMTRTELEDRMAVMMGGRVAEELIFQRDLHRGPERPLPGHRHRPLHGAGVRHEREVGAHHLRAGAAAPVPGNPLPPGTKDYSEATAQEIDREVANLMDRAYRRAREVLERERPLLEKVAGVLLEKEVLEGDELRAILNSKAKQ